MKNTHLKTGLVTTQTKYKKNGVTTTRVEVKTKQEFIANEERKAKNLILILGGFIYAAVLYFESFKYRN